MHDTPLAEPPRVMTSRTPARQPQADPRSDAWPTIADELLQGLVHALNNRVAALSAFVELAKLDDEEGDPVKVLPAELAQLQRLNALFGMLPERRAGAEPLELRSVLDDAIQLHEHHPRLRSERVEIVTEGAPAVVRAPRWALARALVMLVHSAKLAVASGHATDGPTVRVRGDDTAISLRVVTPAAPSSDLVSIAERCNGSVAHESGELVLTLPSVREMRRRERERSGEALSE